MRDSQTSGDVPVARITSSLPVTSRRGTMRAVDGMKVESHHLDIGGMYNMSETVWAGCLCAGLDCMGTFSSILIVFNMLVVACLQSSFAYVAWFYMASGEDPTEPERLYGLLRFRVSVGHDASHTDPLNPSSLTRRLCSRDYSLHQAGLQFIQLKNLREFLEGGFLASHLAVMSWLLCVVKEVLDILAFGTSALMLPTTEKTSAIVNVLEGEKGAEIEVEMRQLTVGIDLKSLSTRRKIAIIFLVVLPRMFTAIWLGLAGCFFLGITADIVELLLNTTALYFILELDEMVYKVASPRRFKIMLANLVPLPAPVTKLEKRLGNGRLACIRVTMLFVLLGLTSIFLLVPFNERLQFMERILCDGNLDFVASPNPVTDIVATAATESEAIDIFDSYHGGVLLEFANPSISSREITFLPETRGTIVQNYVDGLRLQGGFVLPRGTSSLADATPHSDSIELLKKFPTATVEFMGTGEPCSDGFAAGSASELENALRRIGEREFGHSNISKCWQIRTLCGRKEGRYRDDLSAVRLLCPKTCGCYSWNMAIPNSFAGAFAHVESGCPSGCMNAKGYQEWWAQWWTAIECKDIPSEALGFGVSDISKRTLVGNQMQIYLTGVSEIMSKNTVLPILLEDVLRVEGTDFLGENIEDPSRRKDLINSLQDGRVVNKILNGYWEIMDGVRHPRGLTGCAFLASFEVKNIWRINMCKPGPYASLRPICPQTCECETEYLREECPLTCPGNVTISPTVTLTTANFHDLGVASPWMDPDRCNSTGKFCENWGRLWQKYWADEEAFKSTDFGSGEYCKDNYAECWW
eukprot:TRINITY_DN9181_c0_g1_i10.p1 TRINITY_DN9181_c0_g1~~TRINITY_DN9181_c0_g1_i10.p1  ORF type:complete len:936 (-),score=99.75 TRINITY_DN9181_c0_g1_i10:74-2503(-)